MRRLLTAIALGAAGCSSGGVDAGAPLRSTAGPPSTATASAVASAPAPLPVTPLLDAPEGGLYAFVNHRGVFRLDGEPALVIPSTSSQIQGFAVGPDGSVWASFLEGGTFRFSAGNLRNVSPDAYRGFEFRGPEDVWAVTEEIEWHLDHFEKGRFRAVRHRKDLKGAFSDNKFEDMALSADTVWIACWNGLFRGAGGKWEKSTLAKPWRLRSLGDELLVRTAELGWQTTRDGKDFSPAAWPADLSIESTNAAGVAAGIDYEGKTAQLFLGSATTGKPRPVSLNLGPYVRDVDVDDRGRTWISTDFALTLLDRDGRELRAWQPGTLRSLEESVISAVAVHAGGPVTLPERMPPALWEIRGRFRVSKNSNPVGRAKVVLCSSSLGCKDAPFSVTTTTDADGSYVLRDVPPGDHWIHVDIPPGTEGCGGIFRVGKGDFVSTAKDCPVREGQPRVCTLPPARVCMEFERPPPR